MVAWLSAQLGGILFTAFLAKTFPMMSTDLSVTLALNQVGTHLAEKDWGEEKTGRGLRGHFRLGKRGCQGNSLLELPEERARQIKLKDDKLERNQSSREV